MKIAFFELEGWEKEFINAHLSGHDIFVSQAGLDQNSLPERNDFDAISVFVNSKINKVVLDCFPNLKYIATRSTGFDHIDLKACAERNILVSYVPGYGDNTVAEFAFGLLLNLTRKIYNAADQIKEKRSFSLKGLRGTDIKGKTIGIVGTGRIGREMVKIATGFGMKVIAFDPKPDRDFANQLGFAYLSSLEDLLGKADFISLHCPFSEQTRHLINSDNLNSIKRGAYLVNTARGGLVEPEAVLSALQNGILAGAAFDVLEEEGETKDELEFLRFGHPRPEELPVLLEHNALMNMENVIITPHMAFNTQEALNRILNITLENIQSFTQ